MYSVIKYINDNIASPLSVSELAKRFGYSKWYFCEVFRRFTGSTAVEYIRHTRIQLAALDILDGVKAVDVAMKYGYESQGGFNKAFLKEYGCLPREFCKKSRAYHIAYKEKRLTMLPISDRCGLLREEAVTKKSLAPKICAQYAVWSILGQAEYAESTTPNNEGLISHAIASVIHNSTPIIQDGELIVGYNFGDGKYGDSWTPDGSEETCILLRQNGFSEELIKRCNEAREKLGSYWRRTDKRSWSKRELDLDHEMASCGGCVDANHSVLGYEQVLRLGFSGLLERVTHFEDKNGPSELYDACKTICTAALSFGERYASEARRQLDRQDITGSRRAELTRIVEVCSRVPSMPARTFYEAVQSLWFAHIINTWEDTINANSLGRLDQILYPYYRHDIDSGLLTKEEAFELICCLWIKLYRDYDVQQSCVGGCDSEGNSAVNELSWLMLDATEELDFIRCLSVRYSPETDRSFMRRALEVVGHVQKGVPFFFNDSVMIPALVSKGIPLEEARDYTQIGCVETVIPGKANPHAVSGRANLLKALEYALSNGRSMKNPELSPGLQTGEISSLASFDALEVAVFQQLDSLIEDACHKVILHAHDSEINTPRPYKSLLTEGCLESVRDFNNHGAKYDYYQFMLFAVPNLADSLLVLKKLVFESGRYTLSYVTDQLKRNFPNELFRLECLNKVPKFGNDMDEVDLLAARIIEHCCDTLDLVSRKTGYSFHAQPFTFLWMVDHGHQTAASPDGRRDGEILAYSVSPMQGRDFSGFTALLNSLSKLPTKRTPGTTSAIVEVDPKLFTDSNIGRFADILLAASSKGLCNVQFNTIDADTMLAAQKYPEKYASLAVRVSGFSQKFNLLDKELQDHIIGRTKHQCL